MLLAFLLAGLSGSPADGNPSLDPSFSILTNTRRSATNFNVETIRGLAFDTTQGKLYALNTHGSALVVYDSTSMSSSLNPVPPVSIFPTVNNPSALGLWDHNGSRFAIVVGGGTHGVVKQDRDTGVIVSYLALPSEPMDVVIDTQRNLAFVSCAGAADSAGVSGGLVVQIDLPTFAFSGGGPLGVGKYFIDGVRPTFLNIEMGPGANDNYVFVAPFLSGNLTTHDLLGFDEQVVSCTGLPDRDLFRIDEAGTVSAVIAASGATPGAGTLLTNHERNPVTNDYWILNVESLNAAQHSEPAHRGIFADNRITIAADNAAQPLPPTFTGWTFKPLDQGTGPGQAPPLLLPGSPASNADKAASFPFGLTFWDIRPQPPGTPQSLAFVVSSTGDILRMLDENGNTLRNVELPAGSIPRGVLLSPDKSLLFVYAWGTNRVLVYGTGSLIFGSSATPAKQFTLGADPNSVAVRHGRELWYDADNSSTKEVTCNTCHPRGGMDMLGWDLSDPPLDRKDTMVTQSLIGIEDTFPYHWRGERSLADFNGAFKGILGGTSLSQANLDDFQAFVFSLAPPANPRGHIDRQLDPSKVVNFAGTTGPKVGRAVQGQLAFFGEPNSLITHMDATCAACHGGESGTSGLITQDIITRIPSNGSLDVAHLRQMQHKFFQPQPPLGVTLPSGAVVARPRSGFGFSQDGSDNDIMDFFGPQFFPPTPARSVSQTEQLRADVASFMVQFDQGIAPRAHTALLFNMLSNPGNGLGVLVNQSLIGWLDIAVIGRRRLGPTQPWLPFSAFFNTANSLFMTAEGNTAGVLALSDLALEAERVANNLDVLVLGLPPGNGFRFAVDPDNDGASTLRESLFTGGTLNPQVADTDNDTFLDGYELGFGLPISPTVNNTLTQMKAADNPTTNPANLPTLTTSSTDHIGGRIGKHFVTFSEPVTYSVQLEREFPIGSGNFQSFGPSQMHTSRAQQDTLVAQGLLPSISTLGSTRTEHFRYKLGLIDSAGNTNTVFFPSPTSFVTPLRNVFGTPVAPGQPPPALEVAAFKLLTKTGNTFRFSIDLDDIWRGATPALPSNEGSKVVVTQLVTEVNGQFVPLAIANVVGSSGTNVVPDFTIGHAAHIANPALVPFSLYYPGKPVGGSVPSVPSAIDGVMIDGPFILSPQTSSTGTATIEITASGVPTGTNARLIMMGAFTLSSPQPPGAPIDFSTVGVFEWQLPATTTARRAVPFTF